MYVIIKEGQFFAAQRTVAGADYGGKFSHATLANCYEVIAAEGLAISGGKKTAMDK